MPVPKSWHPGEIAAQQARGYEDDMWGSWEGYQEGAPEWMMVFLQQLSFFSVTNLDEKGRPWSSLLYNDGKIGFIQPIPQKDDHMLFTIRSPKGSPFRSFLLRLYEQFQQNQSAFDQDGIPKLEYQMAGVGVMLHNRRRNKLESVIIAIHTIPKDEKDEKFIFEAQALTTFGNCPKYINTRILLPVEEKYLHDSVVENSTYPGQDLPPTVLDMIAKADTLYLSTRHSGNEPTAYTSDPPRLGNNHRGGPVGYLRSYWDEEKQKRCIILPDWSGNRMMMSIGNITHDPVAGIVIPVWTYDDTIPSSLIQATCSAQVLANEEAKELMRGVAGAVKLWIEDWTFSKASVPIFVKPIKVEDAIQANVGWSPYNPPVRLLKSEIGHSNFDQGKTQELLAKMTDAQFWSNEIATFTFLVDNQSIANRYKPGQHIVIDCEDALDTRIKMYSHMAQFRGGEKDLNDDGTRSWTISFAKRIEKEDGKNAWQFELTLRRKQRGGVTPTLFRIGNFIKEAKEEGMLPPPFRIKMNVLGLEGSTFIPSRQSSKENPLRLFYLLSGIGVTPLLPHLSELLQDSNAHANLLIILSTRNNESTTMQNVIRNNIMRTLENSDHAEQRISIRLILLVSSTPVEDSMSSEENGLQIESEEIWKNLPREVNMEFTELHGKRLTIDSFNSNEPTSEDEKSFVLSKTDSNNYLHNIDSAVVCAAPLFANLARKALTQANIPEDVQHVESFSF